MKASAILKLLPGLAAAAFLVVAAADAPTVYAQDQGGQGAAGQDTGGKSPEPFPGPSMTDEQRRAMKESFGAMTLERVEVGFDVAVGTMVPETVMLRPVPDEIVTATPAVRGHHYFAMPDGRIVLVEPADRRVVMVLD